MSGLIPNLLRHIDRNARRREVEEELRFHIEMQAADYERTGLTSDESLSKAQLRFGDLQRIRNECVELKQQSSVGMWILKMLFTLAFVLGVFVRNLGYERPVTRMGDVLIMIAVFGGLLVMGKKMRLRQIGARSIPVRLELQPNLETPPQAFDEDGRTPFERANTDN